MAETRTVFTILENNSTAEGVKLPARSEGDAVGGNHAPAVIAKDSAGNYSLIELASEGDASTGVNKLPSLPVMDLSGDMQQINARDEGDAISGVDALPGLIAKDNSGNFKYLLTNADGELVVSNEGGGVKKYGYAKVTPAGINTLTTVVNVILVASKTHEDIEFSVSNSFPTMWEICKVDDAAGTPVVVVLFSTLTGPGQYSIKAQLDHLEFSSSATGIQHLRIRGTQLQGNASDMHGYVAASQKV